MKLPFDRIQRSDLATGLWIALLASLVFACFHFFGVTDVGYDARIATRSVFVWIWRRWETESGLSPFAHGMWVPLLFLVMLWTRRNDLKAAAGEMSRWGFGALVLAMALHWVGARAQQTRLSLLALILVLWAIPVLWRGRRVGSILALPCAVLIFTIPLGFLERGLSPLRWTAVHASDVVMSGLGLPVQASGSRLLVGADRKAVLDLADAASGLHAFLALTLVALAAGYFRRLPIQRRFVLLALVPPAFVLGHMIRSIMFGIPAMTLDPERVTAAFHAWSGPVFLGAAILLLVLLPMALDPRRLRHRWARWMTPPTGGSPP